MSLSLSAILFLNRKIQEVLQNPQASPRSLTPVLRWHLQTLSESWLSPEESEMSTHRTPQLLPTPQECQPETVYSHVSQGRYTYNLSGFLISPKRMWQTALPPLCWLWWCLPCFPSLAHSSLNSAPTSVFNCHFISPLSAWQPTIMHLFYYLVSYWSCDSFLTFTDCNITPFLYFLFSPPAPSTFNF